VSIAFSLYILVAYLFTVDYIWSLYFFKRLLNYWA